MTKAETKRISRILVIDLAFIGDVILATPTLRAIRGAFPKARITMMTMPLTASVAEMNPYVDEVMVYDKRGAQKGIVGMWRMAKLLRKKNFDMAICMNFAVRGAVVAWLARIPIRVGYDAQQGEFFLNRVTSHHREGIKHESLNHLEVLKPLHLDTSNTSLEFRIPEVAEKGFEVKADILGIPKEGAMLLCPIGSYEKKNLPELTAVQVIHHMEEKGPVYLIGGKGEREQLDHMAKAAGLDKSRVLAGTFNLQELAVLLQHAELMVTVDTGPMHMAQAAGCPTVAMFGPTDPKVWGPRGKADITIYHERVCSPCWGKAQCADGCMGKLTPAEIINAIDKRLAAKGKE